MKVQFVIAIFVLIAVAAISVVSANPKVYMTDVAKDMAIPVSHNGKIKK